MQPLKRRILHHPGCVSAPQAHGVESAVHARDTDLATVDLERNQGAFGEIGLYTDVMLQIGLLIHGGAA